MTGESSARRPCEYSKGGEDCKRPAMYVLEEVLGKPSVCARCLDRLVIVGETDYKILGARALTPAERGL